MRNITECDTNDSATETEQNDNVSQTDSHCSESPPIAKKCKKQIKKTKVKIQSNTNSDDSEIEIAPTIAKSEKKKDKLKINPIDVYKDTMEWMEDFKEYNDDRQKKPKNESLPWVERFRPKTMDQIMSQNQIVITLKKFIKKKQLPHLLLYGPPGTGKTSTIIACAREMYKDNYSFMVLEINASEERGIEVIRNKVKDFIITKGVFLTKETSLFKLVILDEADAMTSDAQAMLRSVIEKHTENVRFCLICNCIKKINVAVQSRCTVFKFAPLSLQDASLKLKNICASTNVTLTDDGVSTIMRIAKGDMRKAINILQSTSMIYEKINNKTVTKCVGYPTNEHIVSFIKIIMTNNLEVAYKNISTIILSNGYAISDVITEISNTMIDRFISGDKSIGQRNFCVLVNHLKELEMNLTVCPDENMQIAGIISAFKLAYS